MKEIPVVISGASCRLPQADSVVEFEQKLYAGVDMVTEGNPYWDPGKYVIQNQLLPCVGK